MSVSIRKNYWNHLDEYCRTKGKSLALHKDLTILYHKNNIVALKERMRRQNDYIGVMPVGNDIDMNELSKSDFNNSRYIIFNMIPIYHNKETSLSVRLTDNSTYSLSSGIIVKDEHRLSTVIKKVKNEYMKEII